MSQIIKLKSSSTPSSIPDTTDLILGELAVNTYDGKLFTKKDDGSEEVVEVGKFEAGILAGLTNYQTSSVADMILGNTLAGTVDLALGQIWGVSDYYGGATPNNSGMLFFRVVGAGTGTDDGGQYVDVPGGLFQLERIFDGTTYNPKHWGCYCDMSTDDTAAFTSCVNFVKAIGGQVAFEGKIRLTSTINIDLPISITGTYPNPYLGSLGNFPSGSWLYFDHSGIGLNIEGSGGQIIGSVHLDGFGTIRNQTEPVDNSWVPQSHAADIDFKNCDLVIGDLLLLNPTRGIVGSNGNAGRFTVTGTLRGQPLLVGLELDDQFDAPNINSIHWWPFWRDSGFVHEYTLANLIGVDFGRVDNPFIHSLFTIFASNGLRIKGTLNGTVNKMRLNSADFDRGRIGINVDGTSNLATLQMGNITAQGEDGEDTSIGMQLSGINARVQISNLSINQSGANAFRCGGSSNTVSITNLDVNNFNLSGIGFPAVECEAGNVLRLNNKPDIRSIPSGSSYGGSGVIFVDEWRDFTPVITSTSGSITTVGTVTGKFKLFNDTVHVSYAATVTTNGTGSGAVRMTLPYSSSDSEHIGIGREVNLTGSSLTGTIPLTASYMDVVTYNNAYPAADGSKLIVSANYNIG